MLSRGEEMTSRNSPGDGVWKRPLDAILAFPLPVLETAYGRAKSQAHNEKTPTLRQEIFCGLIPLLQWGKRDSVMQEGKELKALSDKAALHLPEFSSELCLTIPALPVEKLRQGDLLEADTR